MKYRHGGSHDGLPGTYGYAVGVAGAHALLYDDDTKTEMQVFLGVYHDGRTFARNGKPRMITM